MGDGNEVRVASGRGLDCTYLRAASCTFVVSADSAAACKLLRWAAAPTTNWITTAMGSAACLSFADVEGLCRRSCQNCHLFTFTSALPTAAPTAAPTESPTALPTRLDETAPCFKAVKQMCELDNTSQHKRTME